jgi:hypothetical protein
MITNYLKFNSFGKPDRIFFFNFFDGKFYCRLKEMKEEFLKIKLRRRSANLSGISLIICRVPWFGIIKLMRANLTINHKNSFLLF